MTVVVDADVLIGALDGSDAHHAEARRLLTAWHAAGEDLLVSVVNLTEVLVAPAGDPQLLRRARRAVAALGIRIHRPSEAIGVDAARLRRSYPISVPDAYCLATVRQLAAAVASFDANILAAARAERIRAASGAAAAD